MSQTNDLRRGKLAIILLIIIAFMTTNTNISYANEVGDQVERSLQGTITDEAGQPVEGATVQVGAYSPNAGFHFIISATTDEEGVYAIPSYSKTLGDAVSAILNVKGYVVVFEVQSEILDFQIPEQKASITGKITYIDEFATPVSNYPISLSVYLGRGGRIKIADSWSDSEGNYTMSVIPGEFNSARGVNQFSLVYNNNLENLVELHSGNHKVIDQQVFDMHPGTYLNGRLEVDVTDESDVPIQDAVVVLAGTDIPLFQAGNYFFSDVIKGGSYTLRVMAPGYMPAEENIEINGGVYRLSVKLIKNNPPVVIAMEERAPDYNGWYNKDVWVSFQAFDEEAEPVVDPPFLVSAEGAKQAITGSAIDAAGLRGTGTVYVSLDKTAPVTEAAVSERASNGNWYNSDIHVSLSSNDNLSGIEYIAYSLDNGSTWSDYEDVITISEEGENSLLYRSTDQAGNTEQPKQLVVNIDKTSPTLQLTLNRYALSPVNNKMIQIHAIVDGIDAGSGIAAIQLTSITSSQASHSSGSGNKLIDIQNAEYGTFDTAFDLRAENSGKGTEREYTIIYSTTDKAGNAAIASAIVVVSKDNKDDKNKKD
ncbi:carboxypeptidase-like regulatory domain-containing protein [Paenibacillus prosopidis]|uniref:Carboxypeptidase family protein n=1 Tax=Paenibacillus prosopidis TaxID=630520 RepID=A0A368W709_9BACL|nr:carboxypeptidase-like regulatory domain-containing protein [Paenibacillus prosopidis]RCW51762.1 hypothetical protein DFP97_101104 [Paenibacillus prosopidis]